jgi:hypothetical protein
MQVKILRSNYQHFPQLTDAMVGILVPHIGEME